jgi:hypothetical protein
MTDSPSHGVAEEAAVASAREARVHVVRRREVAVAPGLPFASTTCGAPHNASGPHPYPPCLPVVRHGEAYGRVRVGLPPAASYVSEH